MAIETRCQNCGAVRDAEELVRPIPDVEERVAPGETMPYGECPDCGAVCHRAALVTKKDLQDALLGLLEWEARMGGWDAQCWKDARGLIERIYEDG